MEPVDLATEREAWKTRQTAAAVDRSARVLLHHASPGITEKGLELLAEFQYPHRTGNERTELVRRALQIRQEEGGRHLPVVPSPETNHEPMPGTNGTAKLSGSEVKEQLRRLLRVNPEITQTDARHAIEQHFGCEKINPGTFHPWWHAVNQEVGSDEDLDPWEDKEPAAETSPPAPESVPARAAAPALEPEPVVATLRPPPAPAEFDTANAVPDPGPPERGHLPIEITSENGSTFRIELHLVLDHVDSIRLANVLGVLRGAKGAAGAAS